MHTCLLYWLLSATAERSVYSGIRQCPPILSFCNQLTSHLFHETFGQGKKCSLLAEVFDGRGQSGFSWRSRGIWVKTLLSHFPTASDSTLSRYHLYSLNPFRVLGLCSAAEHTEEPWCQGSMPVWSRRRTYDHSMGYEALEAGGGGGAGVMCMGREVGRAEQAWNLLPRCPTFPHQRTGESTGPLRVFSLLHLTFVSIGYCFPVWYFVVLPLHCYFLCCWSPQGRGTLFVLDFGGIGFTSE